MGSVAHGSSRFWLTLCRSSSSRRRAALVVPPPRTELPYRSRSFLPCTHHVYSCRNAVQHGPCGVRAASGPAQQVREGRDVHLHRARPYRRQPLQAAQHGREGDLHLGRQGLLPPQGKVSRLSFFFSFSSCCCCWWLWCLKSLDVSPLTSHLTS